MANFFDAASRFMLGFQQAKMMDEQRKTEQQQAALQNRYLQQQIATSQRNQQPFVFTPEMQKMMGVQPETKQVPSTYTMSPMDIAKAQFNTMATGAPVPTTTQEIPLKPIEIDRAMAPTFISGIKSDVQNISKERMKKLDNETKLAVQNSRNEGALTLQKAKGELAKQLSNDKLRSDFDIAMMRINATAKQWGAKYALDLYEEQVDIWFKQGLLEKAQDQDVVRTYGLYLNQLNDEEEQIQNSAWMEKYNKGYIPPIPQSANFWKTINTMKGANNIPPPPQFGGTADQPVKYETKTIGNKTYEKRNNKWYEK